MADGSYRKCPLNWPHDVPDSPFPPPHRRLGAPDGAAQPGHPDADRWPVAAGRVRQPPGSSPRHGFDCSGLVQHVYREALGIELPRTSREMGMRGTKVARADLAPGDLVFFQTGRHPNSHVGIYIGRGRFVHAPSSGSIVRVEAIDKRYWMKRFNGGRRPVKI